MSRSRLYGVVASVTLILALFVVLPRLGAQERKREGKDDTYRSLGLFTEVYHLVSSNYVEEVDRKKLFSGAFAGITDALDPFSEYIPPDKMEAFLAAAAARERKEVVDPGIVLARRYGGYPSIVSVVAGGPAEKAGLRSDDILEKIGTLPARGLGLWEVESRLSGKPGARVSVLVVRDGKPRRRTVEIVLGSWSPSAPSVSRAEGQTVLRVPTFEAGTAAALKELLGALDRTKPLLVDVRGTAAGSFDEAARAAALFVAAGPLAELSGRRAPAREYAAKAGERAHEGRVVVLVDSGTAGPAELFAAALREDGRTEEKKDSGANRLVGEPTVGMGVSSEVVRLASGGALKITVARLKTHLGRPLSPKGLEPDERVFVAPAEEGASGPDLILQRGLRLLADAPAPLKKAA